MGSIKTSLEFLKSTVSLVLTIFFFKKIADTNESGVSPQGRTRVKMKFGAEEGTGDKSQRLEAMLIWIRETKVWIIQRM